MEIKFWSFEDAPLSYRELSGHGGDEDWIVFINKDLSELLPQSYRTIPWGFQPLIESAFCSEEEFSDYYSYVEGFGHNERHKIIGGIILIFAHA